MAKIIELLKDKAYPNFVKNHPIFSKIEKVDKIFPHIGLPNSSEEITIDNSDEVRASALLLVNAITAQAAARRAKLVEFAKKKESPDKKKMKADRKAKLAKCEFFLKELQASLQDNSKVVISKNGKITLNLPATIEDENKKTVFKSGEGLFSVYNKINTALTDGVFLPMKPLDSLPQFKDFSSKNIPANKQKIVFASDGADGLWDIATMSMRGIQSCQSWSSGNSSHIVGSMIDPFTGIIYITSGANYDKYGPKMVRRCVVRFIVNEKTKQAVLFLERMYPAYDKPTAALFTKYLSDKTGNKLPIIDGNLKAANGHYVPMSGTIKSLDPQSQPYRDSGMLYKTDVNDIYGIMKEKAASIFGVLYNSTGTKTIAAIRNAKMTDFSNKYEKEIIKMIKSTSSITDISFLVFNDVIEHAKNILEKADVKKYKNAATYIESTIQDFIKSLEDQLFNCINSSIKVRLEQFPEYSKVCLSEKPIRKIINNAVQQINQIANDELKKINKLKQGAQNIEELPLYVQLLSS